MALDPEPPRSSWRVARDSTKAPLITPAPPRVPFWHPRRRAFWRKVVLWAVVFAVIIVAAMLLGPGH